LILSLLGKGEGGMKLDQKVNYFVSKKRKKRHSIEMATTKGVELGCGELEEKGREYERYILEFK